VKIKLSAKGIALIVFSIVNFAVLAFAAGPNLVKQQGRVMELDLKQNMMVVSEQDYFWDKNTKFFDQEGSPITLDKLKINNWIYIEGIRDKRRTILKKVYLIPKYISPGERHQYPFME
jgi:hypothetical protein